MSTRFPRRMVTAAGVALILLVGAGCGDDSSSTTATGPADSASDAPGTTPAPAAGTSAPSSGTATGTGPCKYVSTAQASALAGSPVMPGVARSLTTGPVTFEHCDYIFDPGNSPGVTVAVVDLEGNGPGLFDLFRQDEASGNDYQEVSGVGDEAFYSDGNLNVRKGDTGLILFVGRANGDPRGADALPDEKQLAAVVLPQI